MDKIHIIEDYYNILNESDELDSKLKKYMCMRCFYITDDYDYLVDHLHMNCKKVNGNCDTDMIHQILVLK